MLTDISAQSPHWPATDSRPAYAMSVKTPQKTGPIRSTSDRWLQEHGTRMGPIGKKRSTVSIQESPNLRKFSMLSCQIVDWFRTAEIGVEPD